MRYAVRKAGSVGENRGSGVRTLGVHGIVDTVQGRARAQGGNAQSVPSFYGWRATRYKEGVLTEDALHARADA